MRLRLSLYLCSPLWRKSLLCSQVTNLSFRDIRLKRSGASFEPVKRQRQRCVYEKFNTCRQRKLVEASISAYVRYMPNNRYFWGCERKSWEKGRGETEKKTYKSKKLTVICFPDTLKSVQCRLIFYIQKTRKRVKTPRTNIRMGLKLGLR